MGGNITSRLMVVAEWLDSWVADAPWATA